MFMLLSAAGGSRPVPTIAAGSRLDPRHALARATAMAMIWRRRAITRRQLLETADCTLADLGLTRDQVRRETAKPFWRA